MKNFIRRASLLIMSILLVTATACGRRQTSSGTWDTSTYENTVSSSSGANDAAGTSGSSGANSATESSGNGQTQRTDDEWTIGRNVNPGGGKQSILNGLNLGGKTYSMLVWTENFSDDEQKIVNSFASTYNCKIKVEQVNFESYLTTMTTALSSGKPYDIVKMHNAYHPQAAISNLLQPLENSVSSADLVSGSKKTGINWNTTVLNTSWGNHIYYLLTQRSSLLTVMIYNKLFFNDYGLEDAMSLYKGGKWNWNKISEYADIVASASSGIYFFDDTVSGSYEGYFGVKDYFDIADNGKVTFTGATTAMVDAKEKAQKLRSKSPINGETALVDNIVGGKTMMQVIEVSKLPSFASSFKASAAFGKNLSNLGIVPLPATSIGSYPSGACWGYGAGRGADPKAAVAFSVFCSTKAEAWEASDIPSIKENASILTGLYDNMKTSAQYTFLSSDGRRISEVIYPIFAEIENGGDIMKLYDSYSSTVKSIIEYNLSMQ